LSDGNPDPRARPPGAGDSSAVRQRSMPYNLRMTAPRLRRSACTILLSCLATTGVLSCSSQTALPLVSRVDPIRLSAGQPSFLIVQGAHFARGAAVLVDKTRLTTTWINGSVLTGDSPEGLQPGPHELEVRNPDGSIGRLQAPLTVGALDGGTPVATPAALTTPRPVVTPSPTQTSSPTATPTPSPTPIRTPSPTPSPTATPTPSPTPTPTPSPTPSPTPTRTPSPTPSPSPTPTPKPSPTPSPVPSLPAGALEGIDCQPSEFANAQPSERGHVSNDQIGSDTLVQLGRLDGYRIAFAALPGGRTVPRSSVSTVCSVDVYRSVDGASQVLRAQQLFPGNAQLQETNGAPIGDGARTFEGAITDNAGNSRPLTVILWQRNRFTASITITGATADLAQPAIQALAAAVDNRMVRYP